MPQWIAWVPIVLLVLIVPFAFWVRSQIRKLDDRPPEHVRRPAARPNDEVGRLP
jgi:hypothetical protein